MKQLLPLLALCCLLLLVESVRMPCAAQDAAASSGQNAPASTGQSDASSALQTGTSSNSASADAPSGPNKQPAANAGPVTPDDSAAARSVFLKHTGAHTTVNDGSNGQNGTRTMNDGSISQQISTCMDLSDNDGASIQELQQVLLQQLRANAVNVLFGKVYYQRKTGLDKKNFAGGYAKQVASQLELQTEPEYYNGKRFGSLCVRAWVSMPAQKVPTISPRQVRLDNFCYQAAPGQSRETLRKLATTAAVDRVLENIAPGTLVPLQYRQQIENSATINGAIRKLDERTYCLSVNVNVIPLQVSMLTGDNPKQKEAPAIVEAKPQFSLDLKQYKEGDLAPDYGQNIAVFRDREGKSLGSNVHDGAMAVVDLKSHKNFKALVYIKKDIPFDFLHSEELLLFTLHYKNGKYEPYSFNLTITDANQPMAYFRSWSNSTDVFPWANAANFNEYKVEKRDNLIVFFYNGKFMFNFPAKGDELVQLKVPLRWNDRFYNILIYDEDSNSGEGQQ